MPFIAAVTNTRSVQPYVGKRRNSECPEIADVLTRLYRPHCHRKRHRLHRQDPRASCACRAILAHSDSIAFLWCSSRQTMALGPIADDAWACIYDGSVEHRPHIISFGCVPLVSHSAMSTIDRRRSRSRPRQQQEQPDRGIDLHLQLLGGQEAKVCDIDREATGFVLRRLAAVHFGQLIDDGDGFFKLLQRETEIRPAQSLSSQGIADGSVITCIWQPVSKSERQEVSRKVYRLRKHALTGRDIDVLSSCGVLNIGLELLEISSITTSCQSLAVSAAAAR